MIEFACPHCGGFLQIELAAAGQQAQCPSCGGIFVVPGAAAPPSPPEHAALEYGAPPQYPAPPYAAPQYPPPPYPAPPQNAPPEYAPPAAGYEPPAYPSPAPPPAPVAPPPVIPPEPSAAAYATISPPTYESPGGYGTSNAAPASPPVAEIPPASPPAGGLAAIDPERPTSDVKPQAWDLAVPASHTSGAGLLPPASAAGAPARSAPIPVQPAANPAADGAAIPPAGYTFRESVTKKVHEGGQTRELRKLSPEVKASRRLRRRIILIAGCAVTLILAALVLLQLGK